jgi:L-2-hydroxycarboxylate dehydrogenase (NAD+)
VLPVHLFEDPATYRSRMDKAIREIRGVRPRPGVERVYLPGERERRLLAERRRTGIPVGEGVFEELARLGTEYGLTLERAGERA